MIGDGYIASKLGEKLAIIYREYSIITLSPTTSPPIDLTDISTFEPLREILSNSIVYILAAVSSDPAVLADRSRAFKVNVEGMFNFSTFLYSKCKPSTVIFTSSEWVYSPRGEAEVSTDPRHQTSPYGRQKLFAETLLLELSEAWQVKTYICRLGIVWGGRSLGGACESISSQYSVLRNRHSVKLMLGNLSSARRFIHVADAVFALARIHKAEQKIYDLAGPEVVYVRDIVAACEKHFGFAVEVNERDIHPSYKALPKELILNPPFTWVKKDFATRMEEYLSEYFPV